MIDGTAPALLAGVAQALDEFAAEQPLYTATTPAADDFGTDLACLDDIDELLREVSGVEGLAQAIYRRITTPRGALLDAPNYGRDIRRLLSKGLTPVQLEVELGLIAQEIEEDERVESATLTVSQVDGDSSEIVVSIRVVSKLGPFTLTVDVTQAGPALRAVSNG